MERPLLAKSFAYRELAVGWSVLTHNLWAVARMAEAEQQRQADMVQQARPPKKRIA